MSPARARTRTARSGVERTNHEATVPPKTRCQNILTASQITPCPPSIKPLIIRGLLTYDCFIYTLPIAVSGIANTVRSVATRNRPWTDNPTPWKQTLQSTLSNSIKNQLWLVFGLDRLPWELQLQKFLLKCSMITKALWPKLAPLTIKFYRRKLKIFPKIHRSEWYGQWSLKYAQKCSEIWVKNSVREKFPKTTLGSSVVRIACLKHALDLEASPVKDQTLQQKDEKWRRRKGQKIVK